MRGGVCLFRRGIGRCWSRVNTGNNFWGFWVGGQDWVIFQIWWWTWWRDRCSRSVSTGTWDRYCPDRRWQRRGRRPTDWQVYIPVVRNRCSFLLCSRFIVFIWLRLLFLWRQLGYWWLLHRGGCFYQRRELSKFVVRFQRVLFDWLLLQEWVFLFLLQDQVFTSWRWYPEADHSNLNK